MKTHQMLILIMLFIALASISFSQSQSVVGIDRETGEVIPQETRLLKDFIFTEYNIDSLISYEMIMDDTTVTILVPQIIVDRIENLDHNDVFVLGYYELSDNGETSLTYSKIVVDEKIFKEIPKLSLFGELNLIMAIYDPFEDVAANQNLIFFSLLTVITE